VCAGEFSASEFVGAGLGPDQFQRRSGDTIAFVGRRGGKSTLVKLLVGLYVPQAGEILYNGIPSQRVDMDRLRGKIGVVTQDPQLFSGSIRENLLFVNPRATDRNALKFCGKQPPTACWRERTRIGYADWRRGMKVSGGEKQRLSIARALLRHPQLLLFDEATSSLDSLTEEEISRTIRDVAAQQAAIMIVIAHGCPRDACRSNLRAGARAHCRIWTAPRVARSEGLYAAMWRLQVANRMRFGTRGWPWCWPNTNRCAQKQSCQRSQSILNWPMGYPNSTIAK